MSCAALTLACCAHLATPFSGSKMQVYEGTRTITFVTVRPFVFSTSTHWLVTHSAPLHDCQYLHVCRHREESPPIPTMRKCACIVTVTPNYVEVPFEKAASRTGPRPMPEAGRGQGKVACRAKSRAGQIHGQGKFTGRAKSRAGHTHGQGKVTGRAKSDQIWS